MMKFRLVATSILSLALVSVGTTSFASISQSGLDTSSPSMPLLFAVGGSQMMSLDTNAGLQISGALSALNTNVQNLTIAGPFVANKVATFNDVASFNEFVNFNSGLQIENYQSPNAALLAIGPKYQFTITNEGQQLSMFNTDVKDAGVWISAADGIGSILIGGGGNKGAATPTVYLGGAKGTATFSGSGYFGGTLTVKGTLNANNGTWTTSDRRLKKDITPLGENGVDLINQLKPVTFEWKAPERASEGTQLGFIAQDVQTVLPPAVHTTSVTDDTLRLRYDAFIPVIVKALQEQQKTIEAQEEEISSLRDEISKIKN